MKLVLSSALKVLDTIPKNPGALGGVTYDNSFERAPCMKYTAFSVLSSSSTKLEAGPDHMTVIMSLVLKGLTSI